MWRGGIRVNCTKSSWDSSSWRSCMLRPKVQESRPARDVALPLSPSILPGVSSWSISKNFSRFRRRLGVYHGSISLDSLHHHRFVGLYASLKKNERKPAWLCRSYPTTEDGVNACNLEAVSPGLNT